MLSPQEAVRALVSARGHLFSGSDDTTVRVWNAQTLQLVKLLDGHNDNVRVLTVDDRFLFSGSWDKTIRVWDMNKDYQCIKVLAGHAEAVLALAAARGFLASGSYDSTVRFWSLESMSCVHKCEGHVEAVRVLTSSGPQADMVFSGSYDGSIGFFHLPQPGGEWPSVPRGQRNAHR